MTEYEMFGWHHGLNRLAFEQAPGDSEGQESLVCCPHQVGEWDTTSRLINTARIDESHFTPKGKNILKGASALILFSFIKCSISIPLYKF